MKSSLKRTSVISTFACCASVMGLFCANPFAAANTPKWDVVWSDQFDGTSLDRTKWSPEESCWGGGNNERQCYTDRPENIQVKDGVLRLIARPERFTGPLYPEERNTKGERKFQWYTSGKIRTQGIADWTYGRVSARMKLPAGQGTWPAFWMMPSTSVYGRWPLSGEIDIMEAVNLETPCEECEGEIETRTSGALHFGDVPPNNTYLFSKADEKVQTPPSQEWNTYSIEWAEGVIQWFVNDDLFMRLESDDWHTAAAEAEGRPYAPFDQPFYVMLNLAVGGNLPEKSNGAGFDKKSFPAELLVDWVQVEQCAGDLETGRACLTQQEWNGTPQGPWETMAR
ncbi:glycoside hydrolase family 16 protein [Parvularcula marina]|uniref:Glycoside hydrolase family 16 protein n=1 Tax=Parvularcula marina TaxID=2292771 RepID=A0A371RHL2_9PROT|nr:glycoside hydrolase family 16 protein [Parvularcula marina]